VVAVRAVVVLTFLAAAPLGCGSPAAPTSSPSHAGRFAVTVTGAGVTIGGILIRPEIEPGTVRPAVVVVHGSLPAGTSGAATFEPVAQRFSRNGFISLAVSLRGWPPSGGVDDCGLLQPEDIVQVVGWLRGEPGVDAGRIALAGFSKGGQIVLLAAARGAPVQAVVAVYPVTDYGRLKTTTSGDDIRSYVARVCEAGVGLEPRTPLALASRIAAPVLLLHGDADTRVTIDQSQLMAEALQAAGRQVELFVLPGAGHGFTDAEWTVAWPVVDAFLASRLGWR
jgi:dipeptidyl aminopeptidase/acylaminoacyl peptidase